MTVETGTLAARRVRTMFDRIAPVYDAMNRTMTARARPALAPRGRRGGRAAGDRVLDACCGTGDLALAAKERAGGAVTGPRLLASGCSSAPAPSRARSSGSRATRSRCPSRTARFDAATVGFGVRNLDDLERGLAELRRVLRPGGRLAMLEITQPRGVLAPFYRLWFDRLVPLLGRVLPGGSAYTYLPASVRRFPGPEDLAALLREAGLRRRSLPPLCGRDRGAAHRGGGE